MNPATVIVASVLAVALIAIITGMIRNVKKGKSFCGADYGDVVNGRRKKI